MPWKESCAMDERARFCQQVMEGDLSIAELCRAFGISRVTGYKWIDRYQSGGVAALADQSRARHTQPQAYSQRICDMVIRARIKHPTWGAKKIRPWLAKRHPHAELPATTTMETMLRDAGLVRARRRSRRFEGSMGDPAGADRPNGVWSVDFKGEFRLGDGSYCYPLTVFDNYSRYLLSCDALCSTRFEPTLTAFHRLFGKQGLPDRIRSDNGSPFTSCGHGRLSRLSVYWMSLGIDAGLVRARRRSRRFEGSMGDPAAADRPNGVWSVDFKGEFRLGDGSYCYPLTVFDNYSRYLLSCDALCSTRFEPTLTAFHRLFGKQGLPDRIRSDNGSPFTSCGHGRLSRLSVYWMSLGIEVERTRPGRPQDNGRHERMHRTLKQDTARPPTNTKSGQQRRFNEFRRKYNQERPHEALDMKCPCEFYEASTRPYEQVEYEYPGYWEVRKISRMGQIAWKGRQLFLSEALIGHRVGLVEIDDGIWKVSFRQLPLARLIGRRRDRSAAGSSTRRP